MLSQYTALLVCDVMSFLTDHAHCRDERGEYISRKYLERKYIEHSVDKEALLQELAEAVDSRDIKQLLQVYAEGVDLATPLPGYSRGMTALHLAIELEDLTSLHIVDFLLGNG